MIVPPSDEISDENNYIEDAVLLKHNDKIRMVVGILVAVTTVIAAMYLVSFIVNEDPFGIKPTKEALQLQSDYRELVQLNEVKLDGSGIRICIVDSGIDTSHDDISGMNLYAWRDFIDNREEPYDDQGHGTSMAGILVADGQLKGVAPEVELVVAKALTSDGTGDDSIVAEAIDWCVEQGSHIISLSLGGAPGLIPFNPFSGRDSGDAANDAINQGIVVIAAAGNDGGANDDGDVAHPSSETLVISVGGITVSGDHWSGSSTGDNDGNLLPFRLPRSDPNKKPEIMGPGEKVPVINNEGTWSLVDGTSAATVYITGAVAILMQANSQYIPNGTQNSDNVEQIKQAIVDSAKPKPGQDGHDDNYGYGMIQMKNLLDLEN